MSESTRLYPTCNLALTILVSSFDILCKQFEYTLSDLICIQTVSHSDRNYEIIFEKVDFGKNQ